MGSRENHRQAFKAFPELYSMCQSLLGWLLGYFLFLPLFQGKREGGGGSEGRGNFSKIRGKGGKKGGGGGVDAGKGSGAFLGGRRGP